MNAAAPVAEAKPVGRPLVEYRDWQESELRGVVDEMLWSAGIYADQGRGYVELGDDAGLEYSVRCLIARVKVARDVLAGLKALKAEAPDAG